MQHVIKDLLYFALKHLVMHGRLVYWLPTTEDQPNEYLPEHPCFRTVAKSLQNFGKWGRWLITAEKIADQASGNEALIRIEVPTRHELRSKVYGIAANNRP